MSSKHALLPTIWVGGVQMVANVRELTHVMHLTINVKTHSSSLEQCHAILMVLAMLFSPLTCNILTVQPTARYRQMIGRYPIVQSIMHKDNGS